MKKIFKRATALVMSAAIISSFSFTAMATTFPDVPTSHWAYNTINSLTEQGIFKGYTDGTFRPDGMITHEEFTTAVVNYVCDKLGQEVEPVGDGYEQYVTDDKSDARYYANHWTAWAQPYLNKAVELGLIGDENEDIQKAYRIALGTGKEGVGEIPIPTADSPRSVAVDTPITREEAARILARVEFLTNPDIAGDVGKSGFNGLTIYNSVSYIPDWLNITPEYRLDVLTVYKAYVMRGDENYLFNPQQNLTRAEAITVMNNLNKDTSSLNFSDEIINPVNSVVEDTYIDAENILHMVYDWSEPRYVMQVTPLLELACRRVIELNETYPQRNDKDELLYVWTDEEISEVLESAKGKFYEDLITRLMNDIQTGVIKFTGNLAELNRPEWQLRTNRPQWKQQLIDAGIY